MFKRLVSHDPHIGSKIHHHHHHHHHHHPHPIPFHVGSFRTAASHLLVQERTWAALPAEIVMGDFLRGPPGGNGETQTDKWILMTSNCVQTV